MANSYVGVTGFTTPEQICTVAAEIPRVNGYSLMAGVLVSDKTLRGQLNKYPNRYPRIDLVKRIFIFHTAVINLIHYHTHNRENLAGQLEELIDVGGISLDGIQLNMCWPNPKDLEVVTKRGMRLVLQIGNQALQETMSSSVFKGYLQEYDGLITDVLIDQSGGRGVLINPEIMHARLSTIREYFPKLGIVIAGGLTAETLDNIKPLVKSFGGLSIDTEGRVRTPNDELNLESAKAYVKRGIQILSSQN